MCKGIEHKRCVAEVGIDRCPERGGFVVKITDRTRTPDDPERVAYFWTCLDHCNQRTRVHASAQPMRTGSS